MIKNSAEGSEMIKKRTTFYQHRSAPLEKINTLFNLMAEGMTLKPASKKADIHFLTARKYFEQGDPKRGIKPLKFRLMVFQEKIQKKNDGDLLKRRSHLLRVVMKAITQLTAQVDAGLLIKKANLGQLDKLIRLEMHLRGIGNEGITRTAAELSAEEVRLLAEPNPGVSSD